MPDVVVFVLLLLLPLVAGLLMSCLTGCRRSFDDLLFGAGSLPPFPSGLALALPLLGSASLVEAPAAVLRDSSAFFLPVGVVLGFLIASLCTAQVAVPARVLSLNEFLRLRFRSPAVGLLGAALAALVCSLWAAEGMSRSAQLLDSATNGSVSAWAGAASAAGLGGVLAAAGGLRAVVWAAVMQTLVVVAAQVALLVCSQRAAGGVASFSSLQLPTISPDPRVADTVWGAVFGAGLLWLFAGLSPQTVQRMRAAKSLPHARSVLCLSAAVIFLLWGAGCIVGIGLKALMPCHAAPLAAFLDHLSPPGLRGLVLAGAASGGVSAAANAVSALVAMAWEDLVRAFAFWSGPRPRATAAASLLAVLFAGVTLLFAMLAASPLAFAPTAQALKAAAAGAYAGLLALALLCPHIAGPAIILAPAAGLTVALWQALGGLTLDVRPIPAAALSNDSCPAEAPDWAALRQGLTPFYAMEPAWRPAVALIVTVIVGVIVGRLCSKKGGSTERQLVLCNCCGRCRLGPEVEDGGDDFDFLTHDAICPVHSRSNLRLDDGTVRTEVFHLTGVRPSDSSQPTPVGTQSRVRPSDSSANVPPLGDELTPLTHA